MGQFHALFSETQSPRDGNEEDSTVKAASAVSHIVLSRELRPDEKTMAGTAVHYAFGTLVGAGYGLAAEYRPAAQAGWGTLFGAAVWLGAHVITVPALGLAQPVTHSTPRKEAAEFGAHLVYGAVAESIRRFLRRHLLR
jgi:uncharacterized membrane protein YagU involved in acid resistance